MKHALSRGLLEDLDRFSPLPLRGGRRLRNRVVVPPMASETADAEGFATQTTLDHYQRLAKAGAGLVFVEYTYAHASGRSEDKQLGIQSDAHVAGLTKIAQLIHALGALAGIQLTHAGGKSTRELAGGPLMGPSDIPVPVKDQVMEAPEPMTLTQIQLWKDSFVTAAGRAVAAGFDLVEFHSAHGYGLNQWLSPLTNHRTDLYGGSLPGRARLLLEIVTEVRGAFPGLLLSVRVPGQDFLEEGLTASDTTWLAHELEGLGVDLIDVSSGIGGWRRPRERVGEGYLVEEARRIQSAVSVPVIGVGGIQTGEYIDEAIRRGALSLAAVGRAILSDPEAWGRSQLLRNSEERLDQGDACRAQVPSLQVCSS